MPRRPNATIRLNDLLRLGLVTAALACAGRGPVGPPSPQQPIGDGSPNVRIGVVQAADSVMVGSTADFVVTDGATQRVLASGTNGAAKVTRSGSGPGYSVAFGAAVAESSGPVVVTSTSGTVTIAGQRYRGRAEVRVNSSGTLAGINELPVEPYLYGVVPRELGPNVWPEAEAQKVQAIAARTYTLSYIGRRAADGYDLRATVDDQVYGGIAGEHAVSTAAVDATRGFVLTRDGKLIIARYSSTSGGHTADNEESFAENPVSYMRGVPDMPATAGSSFEATLEAFKSAPYITDLRRPASPFDPDRPRLHRWTFEWSADELGSIISTFARRPVGIVRAIEVRQRGPSGRILSLDFVTDSGSFPATMGGIRGALKYINAAGALVNLPSALFFAEPVMAGGSPGTGAFRVYGGGFGHGVGMAQVGAVLMARSGKLYPEILLHYYQGAQLTKSY